MSSAKNNTRWLFRFSGLRDFSLGKVNLRISLLFSGLFLGTTLTLFTVVFFLINFSLKRGEIGFIQHKLLGYWALAQTQSTELFYRGLESENLLLEGTPFFLRLSDPNNQTLFFVRPELWKDFFQDPEYVLPQEAEKFLILRSPKHSYALLMGGIPLGENLFLQIGISTEDRERTLGLLLRSFTLLLLPLSLISFLIGSFLTARTLIPLKRLTERVQSIIRTGDLKERVPLPPGRDELHALVSLFNTMLDRISQLVASLRETIDTVAHDLRTPLTRLRGITELALQSEDPERWRSALEEGIDESEKILRMMNAIFDIAAIESGALVLRKEQVDMVSLIREMAEFYSLPAEEKNIEIALRLPPSPLWIEGDPNRLRIVIGNLLDNAVKYSPSNTRVLVEGEVEVFPQEHGECTEIVLRIRDQGPGISPEDLPHIWERLYRGKSVRHTPGLGLGLSLVKAMVEAHGGTIRASSDPNSGGALFEIRLPLQNCNTGASFL
ncbi:MAG: ATP-binding protein [Spirochaetales bacterium]